jgi:hypothetical protein
MSDSRLTLYLRLTALHIFAGMLLSVAAVCERSFATYRAVIPLPSDLLRPVGFAFPSSPVLLRCMPLVYFCRWRPSVNVVSPPNGRLPLCTATASRPQKPLQLCWSIIPSSSVLLRCISPEICFCRWRPSVNALVQLKGSPCRELVNSSPNRRLLLLFFPSLAFPLCIRLTALHIYLGGCASVGGGRP